MERENPILSRAGRELREHQHIADAAIRSAQESYQRYFARLSTRIKRSSSNPYTYVHVEGDSSRTPKRIVVNDVELSDLERYKFGTFPRHAISGGFWRRSEVTVIIGESGFTLEDGAIHPRKLMEVRLLPEPSITFEGKGVYAKSKQTLLGSCDHPMKAQAFFELLSAVDSVIHRRLTAAQKSVQATP